MTAAHTSSLLSVFMARWEERDERMALMDDVVSGDWGAIGLDDEVLENRSPNLIQVGLEDTAEAASLKPTVRVIPSGPSQRKKDQAALMERAAMAYMDRSQYELLSIKTLQDIIAFGFSAWTVVRNPESGAPEIQWRDPRFCYPEPGWTPMDSVRTCLFARTVYLRQLPKEYQAKIEEAMNNPKTPYGDRTVQMADRKVTIIEQVGEEYTDIVGQYEMAAIGGLSNAGNRPVSSACPVMLERIENPARICPVVIPQRVTLDGEPRGQFDQAIPVLKAHVRLMALVLDYSDQAVYSDMWAKDVIGHVPMGGGSYIQLGPNGAIGRVPPAVSSLQVDQSLDMLVSNIHLGGRWPKTRPGEIDQAIASAKFVEATAGMMNTVIRTLHLIMGRALSQALRIAFKLDAEKPRKRMIAGVLRNQQFLDAFDTSDIDLEAEIKVDYGIGLGRDPAQTMVLGIQGMQTGLFSTEFVQENFEGLQDVTRERARIDGQQFRDMMMARLLQGLQDGSIPDSALVEIAKQRAAGADIIELFRKYVVEPKQEAEDAAIPSGLGAPSAQPGLPPGTGGPQPPPPPDAAGLLGGLLGGAPAGPAPDTEMIGRLSLPLPGGGFAGTQTTG
jgi:hypothetical protein